MGWLLKRVVCACIGHRWFYLQEEFPPEIECRRCGKQMHFQPFIEILGYDNWQTGLAWRPTNEE